MGLQSSSERFSNVSVGSNVEKALTRYCGWTPVHGGGCGRVVVESQLLDKQKDPQKAGLKILAPRVGLEPTTTRLTAAGSTIELSRNCQVAHVLCS